MIPKNVILIWLGTNASIPTGWVRETLLDGKFPKGTPIGGSPNTLGGSDTHTHTSPTHVHTMNNHQHSGQTSRDGDYETEGGGYNGARDAHIHDWTSSVLSGGALSSGITYQAGSSLPPYYSAIFIKPSAGFQPFKDLIAILMRNSTIPQGFHVCDGLSSTPDLRQKFLRGAAAGADAGATGGSLNHTHDVTHTHPNAVHSHSGQTGYDSDQGSTNRKDGQSGGGSACDRHTHGFSLYDFSEAATQYSGSAGSAETVEPAHRKLHAVRNISGANLQVQPGMIGLWLGNESDIPPGWFLCNGQNGTLDLRDKFTKIALDNTELAQLGGSHTHGHALSNDHGHSATVSHTHQGGTDYFPQTGTTTANNNGISKGHSHQINTPHGGSCSSNTSSWVNAQIQADPSNNEPAYLTVSFIEFRYFAQAALAVLMT